VNAFAIAQALGKARREGRGWRTTCPVHQGYSLNLADGRDGKLLVKCWAGCAVEDIFAKLRRLALDENWRGGGQIEHHRHDGDQTLGARRIWDRAEDKRRSPVVRYLASHGITLPAPSSLRWVSFAKHPSGVFLPAMVARVVNIDDEFIGVHRTFLAHDGSGKAAVDAEQQKMSLGPVNRAAVRLAPFDPGRALIVGEGIESTLSLMQLRGLPGWAALSSSGVKNLILPGAAKRVLIAVDHDRNKAGECAAREAGQRWLHEGREVRLAMPAGFGDWNDVLQGKCDG